MKQHISSEDSIDLLIYMCGKMGIWLYRNKGYLQSTAYERWKGTVLGYAIVPMLTLDAPTIKVLYGICIDGKFEWYRYNAYYSLKALCLWIRGFRLYGFNVVVENPFLKAKSILDAKSKEEALIQVDLMFPGDNSKKVHAYIVEKAIERHIDGKERQLAF